MTQGECGYADIHSHMLHGADDGAADLQSAAAMLRMAKKEGIGTVIATPHRRYGRAGLLRGPGPEEIEQKAQTLREAAGENGTGITLLTGNENFYSQNLAMDLDAGRCLTLNHTKYVLTEFMPSEGFSYIRDGAAKLADAGYVPVLAHCERYECLYAAGRAGVPDYGRIGMLTGLGACLQINACSVTEGGAAKRFTKSLLKEELASFIGTDAHSPGWRPPEMKKAARYIYKKCRKEYAGAVLYGNAQRLLFPSSGRLI